MLPEQDGHRKNPLGRIPVLQIAKVLSVRRDNHAIDVILFDGVYAKNVPVLAGIGGSTFGMAGLVAPTVDAKVHARKTYPDGAGEVIQPDANDGGANRDIYAVVTQVEGLQQGINGWVALGFIYPTVSEMMFPRGASKEFDDMMVIRHPSDVQVTITKDGKTSIQHPAGARITIGTDLGAVNLEGKDRDELYKLRRNKSVKVGVHMEDTSGSYVELDHEGNVKVFAPKDITATAGDNIVATAGKDITAKAGKDATVKASKNITANAGLNANIEAGMIATIKGSVLVRIN